MSLSVRRSLVALSLILSLLLFKPAPLYILDEVDAALDLSHTQNIGQMLRSHFRYCMFGVPSSQLGSVSFFELYYFGLNEYRIRRIFRGDFISRIREKLHGSEKILQF